MTENGKNNISFPEKQKLPSNCSYGHVECSFYNPAQNFPTNCQKCFVHCPKKIKTYLFFETSSFPQNDSLDRSISVVITAPFIFQQNTENFSLLVQKW